MTNADSPPLAVRTWTRVKWTRAGQVAALLGDTVDLGPLGDLPPSNAFALLHASDPFAATRFVAQCLTRVDAAYWVSACLAHDPRSDGPAAAVAEKAVRRWVSNPSEYARRIAYEAGAIVGWDTPEGAGCLAIFLSGGSMAPGQESLVNPSPGVFGHAVAAAVLLAANTHGPLAFGPRISALLDLADAIAAGAPHGVSAA